jgi:Spy/CpxP family protein refolding chaperone
MRRVLLLCALCALLSPAALAAQRTGSDADRRAALQARRDSLENEVARKFMERLTTDLKLDSDQRARVENVMKRSGMRRSELTRRSTALRGRLHRALRSDTTTAAEFQQLLVDHEALRAAEHDLWRQDQEELAAVLTPRQRVQFIISWAHFQETMREIMSQRRREQQSQPQ